MYVDGDLDVVLETRETFESQSPWKLGHHDNWGGTIPEARFCRARISGIPRYHAPFETDRRDEQDRYTLFFP